MADPKDMIKPPPARSKRVTLVSLAEIYTEGRIRSVDPLAVEELANDVSEVGLRQPIEVRKVPHRGNRMELISGAHRYAAFLMLGHETSHQRDRL